MHKLSPNSFGSFKDNPYLCGENYTFTMSRKEIVNQISQAIRRVDPTATAILYGSEARGDARPDSDIDVLILLEGERRDLKHEDQLAGELYEIELATGVVVSPMIMLRKQWENRPFKTPFYINVMNEGIRI
jgi:predicted nucleotidyltransferase